MRKQMVVDRNIRIAQQFNRKDFMIETTLKVINFGELSAAHFHFCFHSYKRQHSWRILQTLVYDDDSKFTREV